MDESLNIGLCSYAIRWHEDCVPKGYQWFSVYSGMRIKRRHKAHYILQQVSSLLNLAPQEIKVFLNFDRIVK